MKSNLAEKNDAGPIVFMEPQSKPMTKLQKATVIIRLLLQEGAAPDLQSFGDHALKAVVDTMSGFGEVDRSTIETIAREFLSELDNFGLSMRSSLEDTLANLAGHVSEEVLARLRADLQRNPGGTPWKRLEKTEVASLAKALATETREVAAVTVSRLPAELAAKVLETMEEARAAEILAAIPAVSEMSPRSVDAIGRALESTVRGNALVPSASPFRRVSEILDLSPSARRERLLARYAEAQPRNGDEVRRNMFTFADIPDRLNPRDVPLLLRSTDASVLVPALQVAEQDLPDSFSFILSNLPNRAADQLRDSLADAEKAAPDKADAAMTEVVRTIRRLAANDQIQLLQPKPATEQPGPGTS